MSDWILKNIFGVFSRGQPADGTSWSTFDQLSSEILELIFIHLNTNSLRSCLQVCKTFRDTIINSAAIMKKLPLRMTDDNWKSKIEFIKNNGKHVRNVEVECGKDYLIIYRLLDFMPNILKLKLTVKDDFEESDVRKLDDEFTDLVNEDGDENFNLESLEVPSSENFQPEFLDKFFKICSLQKLIFDQLMEEEFERNILMLFVRQQADLKHLELRLNDVDSIFTANKMSFKLKVLSINQINFKSSDCSNLIQFLLEQTETIEELRICSYDLTPKFNDVVPKLQRLRKLITFGLLPRFIKQGKDQVLMPNLQHLVFYKEFESYDQIETSCLPNLKSVNVKYSKFHRSRELVMGAEEIANPLQNLQHLKHFRCDFQGAEFLAHLKSPNLERLTIGFGHELYTVDSWTQIAENLTNLKELIITNIEDDKFILLTMDYIERLLAYTANDRLELLKMHSLHDDLEVWIKDKNVVKCIAYSTSMESPVFSSRDLISKKFPESDFNLLTEAEYDEKFVDFKNDSFVII